MVANSTIPGAHLIFIPASKFIPSVIDSTTDVQIRISTVLHVTAEIGNLIASCVDELHTYVCT